MPCNCIIVNLQTSELVARQQPDGTIRHDRECCSHHTTPCQEHGAERYGHTWMVAGSHRYHDQAAYELLFCTTCHTEWVVRVS